MAFVGSGIGIGSGAGITVAAEPESLFEDSDRFEEESLDSSTSEQDLSLINWRGWKPISSSNATTHYSHLIHSLHNITSSSSLFGDFRTKSAETLLELCAKKVAKCFPFEAIEKHTDPIPVDVQLRISFWSFPTAASDIQLYACLGNGNAEEYNRGEIIASSKNSKSQFNVTNMLQIGFHLSGQVTVPASLSQNSSSPKDEVFAVSVTFDRKRITHTNCSCHADIHWCKHVVALCLHRIENPLKTEIRAPVSESLSRLQRDQLQKFAQYLISELPTQVLPTAQRLLDQLCGYAPCNVKIPKNSDQVGDPNLLSPSSMPINLIQGAPDPTAGPSIDDISMWTLDEDKLQSKLKKTLSKFVQEMPASVTDFASVYPQSAAPPASSEFNTLLRPIRGREPEPIWNLLAMVRELCSRQDPNSLLLLDLITQQCINIDALVIWWFTSRTAAHYYPNSAELRRANTSSNRNRANGNSGGSTASSTVAGQQCCASLMDEIVSLWTLLLLNPKIATTEKTSLIHTMRLYHVFCINKIQSNQGPCLLYKRNELRSFQGFKPVIRAALVEFDACFYQECLVEIDSVVISSSQLLYTYPRSNNVLEPAEVMYSKLLEQCKKIPNQKGDSNQPTADQMTSDVLLDDEDDEYEDDFNQSFEENVFTATVNSAASTNGISSFMAAYPIVLASNVASMSTDLAASSAPPVNLLHQPSDSIDEGLDNSSRRGSSDFPPITHFNAFMSGVVGSDLATEQHLLRRNHSAGAGAGGGGTTASASASDTNNSGGTATVEMRMENERSGENTAALSSSATAALSRNNTSSNDNNRSSSKSGKNRVFDIFADVIPIRCEIEILHLLMESLHAHNFHEQCYKVASELADVLLNNTPDLLSDPPPHTRFRKKIRYELSARACQVLHKIVSVMNVLSEKQTMKTLAFQLGVSGLELARLPSPSKMFEVKMYHLETIILGQLRSISCGAAELDILRDKAHILANFSHFRGRFLLPLHLAMIIFENLCNEKNSSLTKNVPNADDNTNNTCSISPPNKSDNQVLNQIDDCTLGFRAALAVLAMKPQVAEADNPLLCESIRRGRTELTLSLLLKFKDDSTKVRSILDSLLDEGRFDLLVTLGNANDNTVVNNSNNWTHGSPSKFSQVTTTTSMVQPTHNCFQEDELCDCGMESSESRSDSPFRMEDNSAFILASASSKHLGFDRLRSMSSGSDSIVGVNPFQSSLSSRVTSLHPKCAELGAQSSSKKRHLSNKELQPQQYTSDRFVTYISNANFSSPAASVTMSTSCSNRPTNMSQQHMIGSHSSQLSDVRALALSSAENAACNVRLASSSNLSSNAATTSKVTYPLSKRWYRGKKCYNNVPIIPNQPSEALAHSLMELAKLILLKASRKSLTSLQNDGGGAIGALTSNLNIDHYSFGGINGATGSGGGAGAAASNNNSNSMPAFFTFNSTTLVNNNANRNQGQSAAHTISETNRLTHARTNNDNTTTIGTWNPRIAQSGFRGSQNGVTSLWDSDGAGSSTGFQQQQFNNNGNDNRDLFSFSFSNPLAGVPNVAAAASTSFGSGTGVAVTSLNTTGNINSNQNQPSSSSASSNSSFGVHRGLHMAALEIGLHALCVLNCVSSNWLSRTYSTYESWIKTQTLELGSPALSLLTNRWFGILTPSEAAGIAQRAGKVYDSSVRAAAAQLALSVLNHANALSMNEITSCLDQCYEEGCVVLEKACKCIENAHEQASPVSGSSIPPQIFFKVARYYKKLHDISVANSNSVTPAANNSNNASASSARLHSGGGGGGNHNIGFGGSSSNSRNVAVPRQVNPTEESQIQASYEIVQQDLQQYLLQQFLFPSNYLLRTDQLPAAAAFNAAAPPATANSHQLQHSNALWVNRINGAPQNLHLASANLPLLPSPSAQNPVVHVQPLHSALLRHQSNLSRAFTTAEHGDALQQQAPVSSIITQTRFSKRAFINGIEALKTIIRRSAENKEEFMFGKNLDHEEDLKWLLGLTIQMAKPENHKLLVECITSGALRDPFLLHSLTDFVLCQLQQFITGPPNLISGLNGANLARQHYLYVSLSSATWQRYMECLGRKLEVLGTASGHGDEDLLQTVTSMRTAAITQYCSHINIYNTTNTNPQQQQTAVAAAAAALGSNHGDTVHRIAEMSRLIVASRNLRPEVREKIQQLFLSST